MTKEEIKALVASKIEGQGTNLDAASVLPTILNWIIDNMGGGEVPMATDKTVGGVRIGKIRADDASGAGIALYETALVTDDFFGGRGKIGFKILRTLLSPREGLSKQEFANAMNGMAIEDVDRIFIGGYVGLIATTGGGIEYYMPLVMTDGNTAIFGGITPDDYGCMVRLYEYDGQYSIYTYEM